MDPRVQEFIKFLQDNAPEATALVSLDKLEKWAAGTIASTEYNNLFALWQAGKFDECIAAIDQFTDVTNPNNPPMKNYNVYGPEIAACKNMIQTLNDEIAAYKANGGNDTDFIKGLNKQIAWNTQVMNEYIADQAASDEAQGQTSTN